MSKQVAVLFADGFEEIEGVTVVDVLRRARVQVTMIGLERRVVTGSHGIAIQADTTLPDVVAAGLWFDGVVLPGGMPGAATLRDSPAVADFVRSQHRRGAIAAAICAAPIVLGRAGLLAGKDATCYPGFEVDLGGAALATDPVVDAGDVVTSRGVGTALEFALALAARFADAATARALGDAMLVRRDAE